MKYLKAIPSLVLFATIALAVTGFSWQNSDETEKSSLGHETLFTIPIGDAGIHYSGIGPESRPWGPSSFRVASDGTFWIADTAANRLVHFDQTGSFLESVGMPDEVVAITDFSLDDASIIVLDASSPQPVVYRISPAGSTLDRWTLSSEHSSLTGVRVEQSDIFVEQEGGAKLSRLALDQGSETAPLMEFSSQATILPANSNTFSLSAANKQRTEQVQNTLARAVVLDSPNKQLIPVLVEEMVSSPTIQVDQTVWLYDSLLQPIGRARIPLSDQYVYVERAVAVGPNGDVYALLTAPDQATVVKLNFYRAVRPILPKEPQSKQIDFLGKCATSCVERSTMLSMASAYLNNSRYLSTTNISGTCSGRKKPRYLSSAGNYYSVSYDWGGNDTVSGFNSAMGSSTNNRAGDIDTSSSETCSRGVDCSGFVGRLWGKSTKSF